MIIVFLVVIIIVLMILAQYNKLIKLKNKVKQAKSGIDVYLNQRFDLIPNLIECVKAYSKHEKELFEEIANQRTTYIKENKNDIRNAQNLNNNINKLIAVAENYPDLKASEQYLNLQKNLSKLESQLQAARRIYNNEVTNYNNRIFTIPSNVVAFLFGFKEENLFEIEEYKKENIDVNLEG